MIEHTTVLVGAGGVGKTTTSAALALASATSGQRVACVSVDPARRLADALGLPESSQVTPVPDTGHGSMVSWMPDSRASVTELLRAWVPPTDPLFDNTFVQLFGDALGGVHELVSLVHLPKSVPDDVSHLVVDTAPGIHSLEALGAPARIRDLMDGPMLRRMTRLFGSRPNKTSRRRFRLGAGKRIAELVGRAFGEHLVVQLADLLSGLGRIYPRIVELARQSQGLLGGPRSRLYVVTTPEERPVADALTIASMLEDAGFPANGFIVNRVPMPIQSNSEAPPVSDDGERVMRLIRAEMNHRAECAARTLERLRRERPDLPQICLPEISGLSPHETVRALSRESALLDALPAPARPTSTFAQAP